MSTLMNCDGILIEAVQLFSGLNTICRIGV